MILHNIQIKQPSITPFRHHLAQNLSEQGLSSHAPDSSYGLSVFLQASFLSGMGYFISTLGASWASQGRRPLQ